jgi:trk system potassium uptake protein TrkH
MGRLTESSAANLPAPAGRAAVAGLVGVALAATLSRHSDGAYLVSPTWVAALQLPACALGCLGLMPPRLLGPAGRAVGGSDRRIIDGIVLAGVLTVAIRQQSIDAALTGWVAWLAATPILGYLLRLARDLEEKTGRPTDCLRAVFTPWLMMVLLAAALLAIPLATQSGVPDYRHNFWLHVSHSAGAAVSAACLVGTSVHSFGEDYTRFGQWVIVVVTQLSGMAFAGIGLAAVRPMLRRPVRLGTIWLGAAAIQIAAIAVTYGAWHDGDANDAPQRIWFGVVHVGSAIWNSGWMMRPEGLANYLHDGRVFVVISAASVIGSLGLPIIIDLVRSSTGPTVEASHLARSPWRALPVWDAGLALALLVGVATMAFVWESPRLSPVSMAPDRPVDFGDGRVSIRDDMPPSRRWTMAVFMSATLRSAGMQSMPVSQGAMSWPTYGLMLGAIWLGGSIAGTAGGLRTSTLALWALCRFGRRRGPSPDASRGESAPRRLIRSIVGFCAFWIIVNLSAVGLFSLVSDATTYENIFEPVAALGNVGLSTGASLHLTPAGRIVIMLLMMIGRWSPAYFWMRLVLGAPETAALPLKKSQPIAG